MRTYRLEVDGIALHDGPEPAPGPTEIVVRVRAAALNKRDLMIIDGTYPLPARPGVIPLSDGAGEVVAAGADVTRFTLGDRVTGSYFARWHEGRLHRGIADQLGCTLDGMLTEYAVLDEQWAVRLPDHLAWEEAATLSCAGVTAWSSIAGADVGPGKTVLTLGTGGVSLYAVQFAKMFGCRVISTTSSDAKAGRLRALGADHVINHRATPDWAGAVRDLTGGHGADLVVDTMGPETIDRSVRSAALYGEVVLLITRSADRTGIEISNEAYGSSMAGIRRVFVGSRADLETMSKAIAQHGLRPVIDRTFAFTGAHDAYDYFKQAKHFGKVVITMPH